MFDLGSYAATFELVRKFEYSERTVGAALRGRPWLKLNDHRKRALDE